VNELFIKIYLDEDVDVLIGEIIRSKGFHSVSTSEAERKGESDSSQMEYAVSLEYAVVTHNRVDYELLAQKYFADEKEHFGIIISVQRPPQEIVEKLLNILDDLTADEMKNQIIYI
jgi:Domain of unknown function (DUF5615)